MPVDVSATVLSNTHLSSDYNVLALAGLNDLPSSDMSLHPRLGIVPLILHANFKVDRLGEFLGLELVAEPDRLQGDLAIDAWVAGAVHDSHGPPPDLVEELVAAEPGRHGITRRRRRMVLKSPSRVEQQHGRIALASHG